MDKDGGDQRPNLLAPLHFDKPEWLDILGGRKAMIESPLIQEIGAEFKREGQVEVMIHQLEGRFGPVGPDIAAGLARVKDKEKILRLSLHVATCASLQDFEKS